MTDARDKKTYKTVKIGKQTWMAENLNYDEKGSKCYENNDSFCKGYGRLYDWTAAKTACPKGWHLPSKSEYEALDKFVGGEKVAGKKLKAKSGWNENDGKSGNGTDEFGFSALPGGGNSGGHFYNIGYLGYWWSASKNEYYSSLAYSRFMDCYYGGANWDGNNKSALFSVRCVKD
jgi:uncharacterized protein (TIGR02145 family)